MPSARSFWPTWDSTRLASPIRCCGPWARPKPRRTRKRRIADSLRRASRSSMQALVLGNARRPGVQQEVERLLPFLRRHVEIVAVDLFQQQDLSQFHAELALVFGGDG